MPGSSLRRTQFVTGGSAGGDPSKGAPAEQFEQIKEEEGAEDEGEPGSSHDAPSPAVRESAKMDRSVTSSLAGEARLRFIEKEEQERLNPANVLVRVLFLSDGPDGTGRRLYSFFVNKNGNVADLQEKIKKDFGWEPAQQTLYFKYRALKSIDYLQSVAEFDIEQDILLLLTRGDPAIKLKAFLREPLADIAIADVKYFNCGDAAGPPPASLEDEGWPRYRDWTEESDYFVAAIRRTRLALQREPFSEKLIADLVENEA